MSWRGCRGEVVVGLGPVDRHGIRPDDLLPREFPVPQPGPVLGQRWSLHGLDHRRGRGEGPVRGVAFESHSPVPEPENLIMECDPELAGQVVEGIDHVEVRRPPEPRRAVDRLLFPLGNEGRVVLKAITQPRTNAGETGRQIARRPPSGTRLVGVRLESGRGPLHLVALQAVQREDVLERDAMLQEARELEGVDVGQLMRRHREPHRATLLKSAPRRIRRAM